MNSLYLRNLSFSYPQGKSLFQDLNLELKAGEVLWLAGNNGSGKTTLMKLIMGLLTPSAGNIYLGHRDVTYKTIEDRVGVLGLALQNPDLQLFASSVIKELSFGPENLGWSGSDVYQKVRSTLDFFHLQSIKDQPPLMQTFGVRKKIALASVYAMDPEIYLLDEPDWSLDREGREELSRLISEEQTGGKAFIIVSHNREYMSHIADRILLLNEDNRWHTGDVKDIFLQQNSCLGQTELMELSRYFSKTPLINPREWMQAFRQWSEPS